jgi:hypothetical protein
MLGSGEKAVEAVEPGVKASLATAIDALLTLDPDTLDDAGLADAVVGLAPSAGPVGGGDGPVGGGVRGAAGVCG